MTEAGIRGLVIDASAVVALLTDDSATGRWVADVVTGRSLGAPELMPFEAANILRRLALSGVIDATAATLAHADLLDLTVDLVPWRLLAGRAWELRANLTVYDAAYVALAEALEVPFLTLDGRIARAADVRCPVLTPPS
ncbi:MAG: type II toxin-antitoxin system VapC family toxin [Chloroflexi bacterium]|nr:type II toxin-antitoxin system VapC family toxin [Chloroflexota bacterium]